MVESRPQVLENRTPFCNVLNWYNRRAAAAAEKALLLERHGKDATAAWADAQELAATASKLDRVMEEYIAACTPRAAQKDFERLHLNHPTKADEIIVPGYTVHNAHIVGRAGDQAYYAGRPPKREDYPRPQEPFGIAPQPYPGEMTPEQKVIDTTRRIKNGDIPTPGD